MSFTLPSIQESYRSKYARALADHFIKEIVPKLAAMDEYERTAFISAEFERILESHEQGLQKMVDVFKRLADDALACSPRPVYIVKERECMEGK